MKADLVVIGSGPAGSNCAFEAARRTNGKILVLEEHPTTGVPSHCSGLITRKGLERLGLQRYRQALQNRIRGANVYSPSLECLTITRKLGEISVFDRTALDQMLIERAIDSGVEVLYGHRARNLLISKGIVQGLIGRTTTRKQFTIHSPLVVSAEGRSPQLTLQRGLRKPSHEWMLPATQFELKNVQNLTSDFVELYHGNSWAPGFFAWLIPTSGDTARVGLASRRIKGISTRILLKRLISRHPIVRERVKGTKVIQERHGLVPSAGPVSTTVRQGFLAVGDAVGQAKPTTGGGFNVGGLCGRIAGLITAQSIKQKDYSSHFLARYDVLWKSLFWRELRLMTLFRRTIGNLTDKSLDGIIRAGSRDERLRLILNSSEDIDLHGRDMLFAAFSPKLIASGLGDLPNLAVSFLSGIF